MSKKGSTFTKLLFFFFSFVMLFMTSLLVFKQRNLMYMSEAWRFQEAYDVSPKILSMNHYEIITNDSVKLDSIWAVPSQQSGKLSTELPTIIYFHGNAGNIEGRLVMINHMFSSGIYANVLMVDYRGYGRSHGKSSAAGIKIDAQAALDWVKEFHQKMSFVNRKIILYGQSLGGAVSINLLQSNPDTFHGLIVENTFLSTPKYFSLRTFSNLLPFFEFLIFDHWDSEQRLIEMKNANVVPPKCLVIVGKEDFFMPHYHSQRIHHHLKSIKSANGAATGGDVEDDDIRFEIFSGGHCDTWAHEDYFKSFKFIVE